jgi:hypothetical protein
LLYPFSAKISEDVKQQQPLHSCSSCAGTRHQDGVVAITRRTSSSLKAAEMQQHDIHIQAINFISQNIDLK